MTKVSVIMGVYNGEEHLSKAINSILNQTFKDFELIICDDGSKDNSLQIIEGAQAKDPRIKLIKNMKNKGLAASLNECLKLSKSQYIARMDSDDISHNTRLDKQINFLEKNPQIAVLGGNALLMNESGIYGERKIKNNFNKVNVFKRSFFIHPTVMIRREALEKVGGYTVAEHTYRTEDYDLWCKLVEAGYKGHNLNDFLLDYREDSNSYSKRKFVYRLDAYKLRKEWYKRLEIPLIYKAYIYKPIIAGLIPTKLMEIWHKKSA